jgi:PAS domain S-box-containing protein
MVTKLVAEGLVKRVSDELDGRGVLVSTTAKGLEIYQRATQQSLTHLISALGSMQQQQLATIRMLLSKFDGSEPNGQPNELERLYAIAPVGLAYFSTDMRFVYINEWLARINGLSVEEHLGKIVDKVIPHVAAGIVPQLRHVLQTGEPIIDGRVEAETPAHPGESRHYMHNFYPDVGEDGTVEGVSCVVQDITERLKLETGNGKSSSSEK